MTKSDFLTPIRAQSSAQSPIRATSQSCTQPARSALRSLVGLVCFRLFVYFGSLSLFWFCFFTIWLHFVYFGSFSFYLAFFPFPSLPALPLSLQVPFIPRPVPTPHPAAPPRSAPGRCSGEVPPGGALPTGARGAERCSAGALCLCRCPAGTDRRTEAPGGDGAAGGGAEPCAGSGTSGGASRGMGGVPDPGLLLGGGSEGGRVSRKQLPSAPATRPGDVHGAGRERRRAGERARGAGPEAALPVRLMGFGGGRVRAPSRYCSFGCRAVPVPGRWVCAHPQLWVKVRGSLSFAPAADGSRVQRGGATSVMLRRHFTSGRARGRLNQRLAGQFLVLARSPRGLAHGSLALPFPSASNSF